MAQHVTMVTYKWNYSVCYKRSTVSWSGLCFYKKDYIIWYVCVAGYFWNISPVRSCLGVKSLITVAHKNTQTNPRLTLMSRGAWIQTLIANPSCWHCPETVKQSFYLLPLTFCNYIEDLDFVAMDLTSATCQLLIQFWLWVLTDKAVGQLLLKKIKHCLKLQAKVLHLNVHVHVSYTLHDCDPIYVNSSQYRNDWQASSGVRWIFLCICETCAVSDSSQ